VEHIDDLCTRHPSHAWQIRRLSLRDPRFRSICDDYGEALDAIEFWRHGKRTAKDRMVAKERLAEFCRIAEDLRQEVLEYLETSNQG
jgi:hypothetical protein